MGDDAEYYFETMMEDPVFREKVRELEEECEKKRQAEEKFKFLVTKEPSKLLKYEGLLNYSYTVSGDYPHALFQTDKRSSQVKAKFDFNQVKISRKENYATRLARMVLQAVTDSGQYHYALVPENECMETIANRWRKDFKVECIPYTASPGHPEVLTFLKDLKKAIE